MRMLYLGLSFVCVMASMYLVFRLWPQPHFTCPDDFKKHKIYLRGSLIYVCIEERNP